MRVIGVLDLSDGLAVHAKGGARAHYGPVQSIPGVRLTPGDALAIASWFVKKCGLREIYIADLDALRGRPLQRALVSNIAALGPPLWLDAGISSVVAAQAAQSAGASRVIVALETLSSFDALAAVCQAVGGKKVAFSLDIRRGEPFVKTAAPHAPWTVVPADAKWYRNLVVAESVVEALRRRRPQWKKTLDEIARKRRAEVAAYRAQKQR